jgi:quercetin dioxygenase-like cupin family protein
MRKQLSFAVLAALVISAALAGLVIATPASGVTSTTIASANLDGEVNLNIKTGDWKLKLRTKNATDVSVVENRVAPGGTFGWHSHPGPSLIIVKAGTITFYRADDPTCSPDVYTAGQALIDPGNAVHVGVNEGSTDVVVVVTRLVPDGAATRIDEAGPATCGL